MDLLHELVRHDQEDLIELARRLEVSPRELVAWLDEDDNQRTLMRLAELHDLRSQVLISRYRHTVAGALIRMAAGLDDQASELRRKACVDVLKAKVHDGTEAGAPSLDHALAALQSE